MDRRKIRIVNASDLVGGQTGAPAGNPPSTPRTGRDPTVRSWSLFRLLCSWTPRDEGVKQHSMPRSSQPHGQLSELRLLRQVHVGLSDRDVLGVDTSRLDFGELGFGVWGARGLTSAEWASNLRDEICRGWFGGDGWLMSTSRCRISHAAA